MRKSRREIEKAKRLRPVLIPYARIFFRSLVEEARVFLLCGREREVPPFHLPSHDSSQFFFELFVSNFTSPPCHDTSFFFFPVYPSAIRGVDELAPRVLPRYLLYHPHSSLRSPLSIPTLFLSLFRSSFLRPSHPFHDRRSVSLAASFALLFLVSRSFHRFFHDSPLTSFHPSPSLSLFRRARWFHLLILSSPPTPKTLFSRGPFASMVIRHPSFSFSLPLLLSPHPNDREKQPPLFPRSFLYLRPGSIPSAVSFSSPLAFSFPLYIHLSIFPFRSLPNQPNRLFPLLLLLVSPRSAGSFSAERLLRFSNVIDASPPRFFPDFSLSRPPFSRRRPTGSFSGKTQAETTAPLFPLCLPVFTIPVLFRVSKRGNWNLPRDFPPLSSFAVLLALSLSSSLSSR